MRTSSLDARALANPGGAFDSLSQAIASLGRRYAEGQDRNLAREQNLLREQSLADQIAQRTQYAKDAADQAHRDRIEARAAEQDYRQRALQARIEEQEAARQDRWRILNLQESERENAHNRRLAELGIMPAGMEDLDQDSSTVREYQALANAATTRNRREQDLHELKRQKLVADIAKSMEPREAKGPGAQEYKAAQQAAHDEALRVGAITIEANGKPRIINPAVWQEINRKALAHYGLTTPEHITDLPDRIEPTVEEIQAANTALDIYKNGKDNWDWFGLGTPDIQPNDPTQLAGIRENLLRELAQNKGITLPPMSATAPAPATPMRNHFKPDQPMEAPQQTSTSRQIPVESAPQLRPMVQSANTAAQPTRAISAAPVSADRVSAYAAKHGLSVEQAMAHLAKYGVRFE